MLALALSLMLVTNLPLYLEEAGWDSRAIGTILGSYFLTSLIVRPSWAVKPTVAGAR